MTTWGSGAGTARTAVLAVHGRGQTPAFMQEQAARLAASGVRFYAPSAAGDSWYPKPFLEPLDNNEPDLSHALEAITAHVAALEPTAFPRTASSCGAFPKARAWCPTSSSPARPGTPA